MGMPLPITLDAVLVPLTNCAMDKSDRDTFGDHPWVLEGKSIEPGYMTGVWLHWRCPACGATQVEEEFL